MAFPMLVLRVLPAGLRGLMFSVIIAALMSGLDSIFNSAATLFTIDIWNHFKPKSSQRQQIWVGRVVVLVLTVLSILWIPLVKNHGSGRLFYYVNEVTNHFSPAIGAVFMLAILWTRLTESGAFWGTIAGFAAGLVRLILLYIYPSAPCEYVYRPWLLTHVHYMTYTAFLFFLTIIVAVVISLFTDDNANIQGLPTSQRFWSVIIFFIFFPYFCSLFLKSIFVPYFGSFFVLNFCSVFLFPIFVPYFVVNFCFFVFLFLILKTYFYYQFLFQIFDRYI